jgi:hypothetical protein
MTGPDEKIAPAAAEPPSAAEPPLAPEAAAPPVAPPASYEDFAGEIMVANGPMPRWFRRLPYITLIAALAYFLYVRAFDPVNLVFAALFIAWMIYTPIAQKRGWFFIPM